MKSRIASTVAGALVACASLSWAQITAPPQPGPPSVQPMRGPTANPADPLPEGPSTLPGTARPVQRGQAQVQIPFGKIPPLSASASQAARSAEIAERNRIEDAAARCGAEVNETARTACRKRLAQPAKAQPAASGL